MRTIDKFMHPTDKDSGMASVNRILFLLLALALTAGLLALVFWGMSTLDLWFESLSLTQQYWLPKVGLAISGLLAAWGAVSAYRRRLRGQSPT